MDAGAITVITSHHIGQAIKRRRVALGMSQEKLAEMLNVSYQQVQRYENGSNKLNVENIQIVAAALEVAATFFFNPDNLQIICPETPYLNPQEQELYRLLGAIKSASHRAIVIDVAHSLVRNQ